MTVYVRFDLTDKTIGQVGNFGVNRYLLDYWDQTQLFTNNSNEQIYLARLNALGVGGKNLNGYIDLCLDTDQLLPTWIDDDTTRRNTINANATTCKMWSVLDSMVNLLGKSVYFRIPYFPKSITGNSTTDIWEAQYAIFRDLETTWVKTNKLQKFCVDLMYLCYQRYGTTCNTWLWSVGTERWR